VQPGIHQAIPNDYAKTMSLPVTGNCDAHAVPEVDFGSALAEHVGGTGGRTLLPGMPTEGILHTEPSLMDAPKSEYLRSSKTEPDLRNDVGLTVQTMAEGLVLSPSTAPASVSVSGKSSKASTPDEKNLIVNNKNNAAQTNARDSESAFVLAPALIPIAESPTPSAALRNDVAITTVPVPSLTAGTENVTIHARLVLPTQTEGASSGDGNHDGDVDIEAVGSAGLFPEQPHTPMLGDSSLFGVRSDSDGGAKGREDGFGNAVPPSVIRLARADMPPGEKSRSAQGGASQNPHDNVGTSPAQGSAQPDTFRAGEQVEHGTPGYTHAIHLPEMAIVPGQAAPPAALGMTYGAAASGSTVASAVAHSPSVLANASVMNTNPYQKLDQSLAPSVSSVPVASAGLNRVTVGLHDPGLGWLEIKTQSTAGQITAALVTASSQTHQTLAAQLPSLAQFLSDRDVHVNNLSVEQNISGGHGGDRGGGGNEGDGSLPPNREDTQSDLNGNSSTTSADFYADEIFEGRSISYISVLA